MTTTVDFQRREGARGWPLFALGTLSLVGALWLGEHWASAGHEGSAAARRAHENAARQQSIAASREQRPTVEAQRRINMNRQLQQPWLPVLRLVENTTAPPVLLLGLAIDPASGSLRIDAEGTRFDQALDHAAALGEPGLMAPALLRSHEQAVDPAGGSVVRFSLASRWHAP